MQRNAEKNEIRRSGASFASPLRASASPRLCVSLTPFRDDAPGECLSADQQVSGVNSTGGSTVGLESNERVLHHHAAIQLAVIEILRDGGQCAHLRVEMLP
jgi:hypothetical protein